MNIEAKGERGPGRQHPEVRSCLDGLRRRRRSVRLAEGLSLFFLWGSLLVVALFALDNLFHLGVAPRLGLLAGALGIVAAILVRKILLEPFEELDDAECALLIEKMDPRIENRLINTV